MPNEPDAAAFRFLKRHSEFFQNASWTDEDVERAFITLRDLLIVRPDTWNYGVSQSLPLDKILPYEHGRYETMTDEDKTFLRDCGINPNE